MKGKPIHVGRRKTFALLIYLAMMPGEHSRAVLTDLLYPTQTRNHAMSDFRQTLTFLRQLI